MFFATGFANAGQVIISQLLGAGKSRDLGRFIGNMMTFLFVLAVVLTFVCLFFCETILELMNTPPEALDEAYGFTAIIIGSLIFTYGYNAVSAILRGLGDSRHPFIFIGGAAVLNVVLDIIFVIVIGMGARGVGDRHKSRRQFHCVRDFLEQKSRTTRLFDCQIRFPESR